MSSNWCRVIETPQEKAARIAAEAHVAERNRKADNRRLMPQTTAFIDAFAAVFGREFTYGRFEEGGRIVSWGKRTCA